ncbi:alpha/beta fold hydrolase [Zavarzinia sp. CC-PAN008]|uniref:alpha/beta fold hydrolase n=1 Tax=Zavarzinia sp. CC-PAN008 TaxID=3243332 RepID=UPI003F749617
MSATALLLLPGLLCDARLWAAQVEELGSRVEATVGDLSQDNTIAAMAARCLASAPPRFALAGLSMGGYVALEIMRQAPERVERLALFDTSAGPDDPARQAKRRAAIASLKSGRFAGVTDRLLPYLIDVGNVPPEVGAALKAMARRVGGAAFVRQQEAILARADSRPILGTIRVPTLVVVGANDQLTPVAEAEEIHRGIAGSRLHVLPDCGHLPAMERPEETTALLREWLTWS